MGWGSLNMRWPKWVTSSCISRCVFRYDAFHLPTTKNRGKNEEDKSCHIRIISVSFHSTFFAAEKASLARSLSWDGSSFLARSKSERESEKERERARERKSEQLPPLRPKTRFPEIEEFFSVGFPRGHQNFIARSRQTEWGKRNSLTFSCPHTTMAFEPFLLLFLLSFESKKGLLAPCLLGDTRKRVQSIGTAVNF